jgi:hypothetical protein
MDKKVVDEIREFKTKEKEEKKSRKVEVTLPKLSEQPK